MNKSKFYPGDRVSILNDYQATGIVTDVCTTSEGREIVTIWGSYPDDFGEIESCFNDYEVHEIELIPHPDTERLNWIINNGARIEGDNGQIAFFASLDDDNIAHGLIGIRDEISEQMKPRCSTTGRLIEKCGCPDCGSSLVEHNP